MNQGIDELNDASSKGDLERIRNLLALGLDINARDAEGRSPLHCASRDGNLESVLFLIEAGARVDEGRPSDGVSPLLMASQNGHLDIVKILLEAGADKSKAATDNGTTPL